jgi:methyl-accepting chemotaxis protein
LYLVALIGAAVGGYAVRTLVNTDEHHSVLLEREAKGATEAARLNILTLDLACATWRALAFPDQDGSAGKGFAVVASEVKALANQTAQATGSIATQIQAMQAATRDAAADIGAIRESIDHINQVTAAIAAAVEQQGSAEMTVAIEGVTGAATETGGAASRVQATSATPAKQAEILRAEVGSFLGGVRAA